MIEKTNPAYNDTAKCVRGGLRIINEGLDEGETFVVKVFKVGSGIDSSKDANMQLVTSITSVAMPKPKDGTKWALSVKAWAEQVGA